MNIIILPLYGIGDVLMTTPALEILKEARSDCKITCLCMFKNTYDLLKNNPHIDSLEFFPFLEKNKAEILKFVLALRGRFDCSIGFYPSNRLHYNMIAYLIGSKTRIGHRYLHGDFLGFNFLKNRTIRENVKLHNVEENVKLLEFFGIQSNNIPSMKIYLTSGEEGKGKELVRVSGEQKKIGIHAGTSVLKGHSMRRWPKEKFVELINSLRDKYFFLLGGPDDDEVNRFISDAIKDRERLSVLRGCSIMETVSAIQNLDLFVTNDSGLMHIASAVGTPVVAIFGPTNTDFVRPWRVRHEIARLNLECSPCFFYSPRPLECKINEKYKCLVKLPVSLVKDLILKMLQ